MVEEKGRQTADKKEGRKPWTLREFGGQTVWDWLHLLSALAIPVVLAAAGLWFTAQQDHRQQEIESERAQQAQKIENQRAEAERKLAKERAQDEALQAYLSQMSSLLLEKDLRESAKDSEERTLARARTLTVLSRLDSARKERLLQFLYEAGLLQKKNRVINLNGADLSGIDLRHNNLSGSGAFLVDVSFNQTFGLTMEPSKAANLRGAILIDANLKFAFLDNTDLSDADLSDAHLTGASLSHTDLIKANLSNADLTGTWLDGADLSHADLTDADLSHALQAFEFGELNLSGATLKYADLSHAKLREANLSDANLNGANLDDASLSDTNLSGADLSARTDLNNTDLSGADLTEADLSGVDLTNAEGITNEELEQQAANLKGATMPNGQKYEDWLKDREAPAERISLVQPVLCTTLRNTRSIHKKRTAVWRMGKTAALLRADCTCFNCSAKRTTAVL